MSEKTVKTEKPTSRKRPIIEACAEMGEGDEVPLVETYSLDAGVDPGQFNSPEELGKYLVEQEEKKKRR